MKTKEYIRLAMDNIKGHTKQTRNIIVGFSFSLTLLVLVFFIFLGFYFGVATNFHKVKTLTSFNIDYSDYMDGSNYINYEYSSMHEEMNGVENYLSYKRVEVLLALSGIYIGEEKYYIQSVDGITNDYIDFIDMEKSTAAFSKAEEAYLEDMGHGEAILEGAALSENINEVLISSNALERLGLNASEVIGKSVEIEMFINSNFRRNVIDANGEVYGTAFSGEAVSLFKDYIIVGVFNSKLYDVASRNDGKHVSALFWLNSNSLYDDDNNYYFPEMEDSTYIYEKTLEEYNALAIADKKVFFPNGFYPFSINKEEFNSIIQFKSLNKALKALPVMDYYLQKTFLQQDMSRDFSAYLYSVTNEQFMAYYHMHPFMLFISSFILMVSSAVFVVTLLNLYNYAKYSIDNRKSYFGMLKAIGLTRKGINKLYFSEILLMNFLALLISFVFSFGGALVVSFIVNSKLEASENILNIEFNMNIGYYFLSFLIFGLLVLGLSFLLSYFLCRNVNKTKIIDLLKD